jgi:phosphoglycolate phosphatase
MKTNSVIICDLDGTLIDSREDLTTGVNLMRAEYSLPPIDIATVTDYVGNGARKLAERSLCDVNDGKNDRIDVDEALNLMRKFYTAHMFDQTRLYPTVKEGLDILIGKGFKIAVVTNKPQKPCEKILIHLGVADKFDVIMGASPQYRLKPDPEMLFAVIEKTGSSPENSWMVGDNDTDLESGRYADVKKCFANYGFGYKREEEYDIAVASFADFAKLLSVCPD